MEEKEVYLLHLFLLFHQIAIIQLSKTEFKERQCVVIINYPIFILTFKGCFASIYLLKTGTINLQNCTVIDVTRAQHYMYVLINMFFRKVCFCACFVIVSTQFIKCAVSYYNYTCEIGTCHHLFVMHCRLLRLYWYSYYVLVHMYCLLLFSVLLLTRNHFSLFLAWLVAVDHYGKSKSMTLAVLFLAQNYIVRIYLCYEKIANWGSFFIITCDR